MAATGLDAFDKTLQTTNVWLDELMQELGLERQAAWHVLGAVLRPLRDRLTLDLAAHLGAQLPLLVRGLFYDQWQPANQPDRVRRQEVFLEQIAQGLADTSPVDARNAARAVFRTLSFHVVSGQLGKVVHALPAEIQTLWPNEMQERAAG